MSFAHHVRFFLKIIFCIFVFLSAAFTALFIFKRHQITEQLYQESLQKTEQNAQNILISVDGLKATVDALQKQLAKNSSHQAPLQELQKKEVAISGIGFFNMAAHVRGTYVVEKDGIQQTITLSQENRPWLAVIAQHAQGEIFHAIDPITREKNLFYARSINDNEFVFAGLSLNHIRHILSTLYVGQTGYWFVTDTHGSLLIHPESKFILQHATIDTLAKTLSNSALSDAFKKAQSGKPASLAYRNEITHAPSWLFFQPLEGTGLIVAEVVNKYELPLRNDFNRHYLLLMLACVCISLVAAVLMQEALYRNPSSGFLWKISSLASGILLASICAAWLIALYFPNVQQNNFIISGKVALYNQLNEFEKEHGFDITPKSESNQDWLYYRYKQGGYVPTGLLINDVKFVSENQIEFVGYIWQRYFEGIHEGVSRGFIFPQIANKPTIIEIGRTKIEKAEIVMWQVRARLNQDFSYGAYPFDVKNIEIQLRHKDFEKEIVLVPDLDAYTLLNPTSLPGISQDAHISNWRLLKSYFSYELENYTTNFGLYAYGPFGTYSQIEQADVPELHFNITAQRHLLDTILTDLLALCVIAVILFALLLTYFAEGFELLMETSAAAFFSTVFAQIQFRSKIPSHEFVYFEFFYFVIYIVILLILTSSLIHLFHMPLTFISYRKNIITKTMYWPFILSLIFMVTIFYVY